MIDQKNQISKFPMDSRLALVILFVVALLLRMGWAFSAPNFDPVLVLDPLHGDAMGYHIMAKNLLQGHGLSWDGHTLTSYRMPGYPAFLAALYAFSDMSDQADLYAFSDMSVQAVRLLQAILGALLLIPVYIISRRLAGEMVAVLACFGVALHPLLIYQTGWLYSETLFILLLWFGLLLLVSTLDSGGLRNTIFAGVALGLAALVRPEIAVFPLFILAIGLLLRWSRQILARLFIVQTVLILILLPWTVRNTRLHGAFVPLTTSAGSNFYAGNNPESQGGPAWSFPLEGSSEVESDRTLSRRSMKWITEHPVEAVSLLPKKMLKFFSPIEMETAGNLLGRLSMPINLVYGLFLLLVVWGAAWNVKVKGAVVLMSVVLWYLITALIFYGGSRVALPAAPSLMILAAWGIKRALAIKNRYLT